MSKILFVFFLSVIHGTISAMDSNTIQDSYGCKKETFNEPVINMKVWDAVMTADVSLLKEALQEGAKVNAPLYWPADRKKSNKGTALHCIALMSNNQQNDENYLDLVDILLENNADINAQDDEGWAPLHCAALKKFGTLKVLERFLQVKNIRINALTKLNQTALHLASPSQDMFFGSESENPITASLLIDAGISLHAKNNQGQIAKPSVWGEMRAALVKKLFISIKKDKDINTVKKILRQIPFSIKDQDGNTLLHMAVKNGDENMIGLLWRLKPEMIAIENNQGQTPVLLSVEHQPIFTLFLKLAGLLPISQ